MGEPDGSHFPSPPAEHIGRWEATGGTETSKNGDLGQTGGRASAAGVVGPSTAQLQNLVEAERHGKAGGTGLEPRTRIREDCRLVPEYRRTRETRWEAGGSTLQS